MISAVVEALAAAAACILKPLNSVVIQDGGLIRRGSSMWTPQNRKRYDRGRLRYPSDLRDEEWAHVAPVIPPAKPGGNKRRVGGVHTEIRLPKRRRGQRTSTGTSRDRIPISKACSLQ